MAKLIFRANFEVDDAGELKFLPQGGSMATNRQFPPNLQIPGQEDWAFAGRDPYPMGYMEQPSGYFPHYCYPYPPPPPTPQFASYGPVYMGMQPMYMPMMGVPYFVPPQYMQAPDMAMSRAPRRSRNASRRVHDNEEHSADHKPAAVQTWKQENGDSSLASAGQALDSNDLMFLFAKQLSPSGVNNLGRIVLPKKEAEAYLPHLVASEGLLLTMADFDTHQNWTFRYRFWSNNKSRMYLLENTRDFVRAHNLQERDMIVIYKDAQGSYVVRGEKYGTNPQTCDNPGDFAPADEDIPTEEEISRREQTLEFLI